MKRLIALKHVAFEDLGYFEEIFQGLGFSVTYLNAGRDSLDLIQKMNPELLVICGGPISVNDEHLYPFLLDEFRMIESRLKQQKATLGLCLGAQSIAKVLGSKIYSNRVKEIGWAPIALTVAGKQSSLRFFAEDKTHVFHWHGETFDLPQQATLLASTTICKNQAFSYGNHTLGLQFHPEVIPSHLEQWYIGHSCELSQQKDLSIDQMRRDAQLWGNTLQHQGELFLNEWIQNSLVENNNRKENQ
ncbi:MAG: glutamine amidotransferase [Chlamydiales bacterium]